MRRPGWPTGPASAPTAPRRSRAASRSSRGGRQQGRDPREKLLIFSDGMDVDTHRGDVPPLPRPGADELRLGHQPDQRFSRLRSRTVTRRSRRSRWSARWSARTAGQRSSSPTIRPRRPAIRRRSRAICACSAPPAGPKPRCTSDPSPCARAGRSDTHPDPGRDRREGLAAFHSVRRTKGGVFAQTKSTTLTERHPTAVRA